MSSGGITDPFILEQLRKEYPDRFEWVEKVQKYLNMPLQGREIPSQTMAYLYETVMPDSINEGSFFVTIIKKKGSRIAVNIDFQRDEHKRVFAKEAKLIE